MGSSLLKEIEERVRHLSTEERRQLVLQLLKKECGCGLNDLDNAWMEVAEERFQAYQSGKDLGLGEEAFLARAKELLGWK